MATHCSTLQYTAAHCNTLQHTATKVARNGGARREELIVIGTARGFHETLFGRCCCSVLQCVAVCCSVCSVLQCVAMCCVVVYCNMLQCVAVCCSVLQCVGRRHREIYSQTFPTKPSPGATAFFPQKSATHSCCMKH